MTEQKKCPGELEAEVTKDFQIISGGKVSPMDTRARLDSFEAGLKGGSLCFARRYGISGGVGVCGLCNEIVGVGS